MIKTISAQNEAEFDKAVNDFELEQAGRVFATQTHIVKRDYAPPMFIAIVFYRPVGTVLK